jgi:hypothetical protein
MAASANSAGGNARGSQGSARTPYGRVAYSGANGRGTGITMSASG